MSFRFRRREYHIRIWEYHLTTDLSNFIVIPIVLKKHVFPLLNLHGGWLKASRYCISGPRRASLANFTPAWPGSDLLRLRNKSFTSSRVFGEASKQGLCTVISAAWTDAWQWRWVAKERTRKIRDPFSRSPQTTHGTFCYGRLHTTRITQRKIIQFLPRNAPSVGHTHDLT